MTALGHTHTLIQVGLVGSGIQHSSTPALHMDEAGALGLNLQYRLFDLDLMAGGQQALSGVLDQVEAQGFAGLNVTYPSKQAVLALVDELSPEASALQAVNTVLFRNGRRIGHNTDWWGFAESFRRGLGEVPKECVVLLGAGGAGAAVAYAAAKLGVQRLTVIDQELVRAQVLSRRLRDIAPQMDSRAAADAGEPLAQANGLIHATPLGMLKSPGMAVSAAVLHPGLWVADIVYVPLETELLRAARALQCRTLDGGGMAVFQAVMAFRLFTGIEPDAERMLNSFRVRLALERG